MCCWSFLDRLDAYFGDAAVVHFDDGEAAAIVVHAFADFGDVAETDQDEAGQGFYAAFAGQVPLHLGLEVAEIEAAIHQYCTAGDGEDGESG